MLNQDGFVFFISAILYEQIHKKIQTINCMVYIQNHLRQ